jgi:hypothetical protein
MNTKKFFTGLTALALSIGLVLAGCEGPTGADGAGGGGTAGTSYLNGTLSTARIQYAIDAGGPLVFAGVTQEDAGIITVPAGRKVTLLGTAAITVLADSAGYSSAADGTLVLLDANSVTGTGTIAGSGTNGAQVVGPAEVLATYGVTGTSAPTPIALAADYAALGTTALAGDAAILGSALGAITAEKLANLITLTGSKILYVIGNGASIDIAATDVNTGLLKATVLGTLEAKGVGGGSGLTLGETTLVDTLKATGTLTIAAVGVGKVGTLDLNGQAVDVSAASGAATANIGLITSSATGATLTVASDTSTYDVKAITAEVGKPIAVAGGTNLNVSALVGKITLPVTTVTVAAIGTGGEVEYPAGTLASLTTTNSTSKISLAGDTTITAALTLVTDLTANGNLALNGSTNAAVTGGSLTLKSGKAITIGASQTLIISGSTFGTGGGTIKAENGDIKLAYTTSSKATLSGTGTLALGGGANALTVDTGKDLDGLSGTLKLSSATAAAGGTVTLSGFSLGHESSGLTTVFKADSTSATVTVGGGATNYSTLALKAGGTIVNTGTGEVVIGRKSKAGGLLIGTGTFTGAGTNGVLFAATNTAVAGIYAGNGTSVAAGDGLSLGSANTALKLVATGTVSTPATHGVFSVGATGLVTLGNGTDAITIEGNGSDTTGTFTAGLGASIVLGSGTNAADGINFVYDTGDTKSGLLVLTGCVDGTADLRASIRGFTASDVTEKVPTGLLGTAAGSGAAASNVTLVSGTLSDVLNDGGAKVTIKVGSAVTVKITSTTTVAGTVS